MRRFIFGFLAALILLAAFAFLWISNPLYAFVGGIVFLVFMMVGFAFLMNLPDNDKAVEDEDALKPRRSGQVRRIEHIEKPEEYWEQEGRIPQQAKSERTASPGAKPRIGRNASQNFGGGSSQPAPAAPPPAPDPDFDKMTFEEIVEWTNPPEPPATEAPPEPAKPQKPARMDTGTFFSVEVDEKEAEELFDMEKVSEIVEKEMEYDSVAGDMKRKMEEGTFGNSVEEVQHFFKAAFEKASVRNEVPDYIDEEEAEEEIPDWLAPQSGDSGIVSPDLYDGDGDVDSDDETSAEVPDWLANSLDEDLIATNKAPPVEYLPDAKPVTIDSSDENMTRAGSGDFDLMGMVGSLTPDKQQEFFALMTEVPIGEQTETQLIEIFKGLVDTDEDNQVSEAQFTAYFPRQASAGTEYGFYVYAHLPAALISADIQQFEADLGGRVPKPQMAQQTAKIAEGTSLGAVVYCDKLNFQPPGAIQRWQSPFVRFDFRFTAHESLVDEFIPGRIAIMMGLIEIASIDFQIAVTPPSPMAMVTSIPHDPLTAANFDSTAPASIYQKIFVSYSRKDTAIAEQYRKAQTMAGNIIFMDTHSIRAGQDWERALKQFIDEADVFQLFWSEHSATSDHVKFEWDYALKQRCPQTRCVQFIRPAYWEKPLASIPPELSHLHFAYVELQSE